MGCVGRVSSWLFDGKSGIFCFPFVSFLFVTFFFFFTSRFLSSVFPFFHFFFFFIFLLVKFYHGGRQRVERTEPAINVRAAAGRIPILLIPGRLAEICQLAPYFFIL